MDSRENEPFIAVAIVCVIIHKDNYWWIFYQLIIERMAGSPSAFRLNQQTNKSHQRSYCAYLQAIGVRLLASCAFPQLTS